MLLNVFIFRTIGLRISAKFRLEYLKALFTLPVYKFDQFPSGQAANTLTNTSNAIQIGISERLGTLFQFTALLFTAIVVAFTYS